MFRTSLLLTSLVLASNVLAESDLNSAHTSGTGNESSTHLASSNANTDEKKRADRRDQIRAMRDETLARLFKEKPKLQDEIASAAGYAVFDSNQTNIVLLVTGKGSGIVFDNESKEETFMKMARLGTGPGIGRKKFKQVLVFKSRGLLEQFVSVGADISASADAVVKPSAEFGGVVLNGVASLNPGLKVYQITERGILLQANWGGIGYLPDKELNNAD